LAEERDLVDREPFANLTAASLCDHRERMKAADLGPLQATDEIVLVIFVHQEPDGASVHAVNRYAVVHVAVQGLQHQAIAAERDDGVGLVWGYVPVPPSQPHKSLARLLVIAGDKRDFFVSALGARHRVNRPA
jgi:hypothetical protein